MTLSSLVSFAETDKYDFNCKIESLAKTLNLTEDQKIAVEEIHQSFTNDMQFAKDNELIRKNAINKNITYMSFVLTKEQLKKYVQLLNLTLNNRGVSDNPLFLYYEIT